MFFNELKMVKGGEVEMPKKIDFQDVTEFLQTIEQKKEIEIVENSPFYPKVLLFGILLLGGITTIFTFIWGLI